MRRSFPFSSKLDTRRAILRHILFYVPGEEHMFYTEYMARLFGIHRSTVLLYVKYWIDLGYVGVLSMHVDGRLRRIYVPYDYVEGEGYHGRTLVE